MLTRCKPAPAATSRYLFRWASARDWSGDANTALEYVSVSSRNSGRSRCRGRSARRCCVGYPHACSSAGGGRSSDRSGPGPEPAAGQGERLALAGGQAQECPRSGLDHRPSMYASPAPVSPSSRMRVSAWIVDPHLCVKGRVLGPEHPDRAVGQHDREPTVTDPARRREADSERRRVGGLTGPPAGWPVGRRCSSDGTPMAASDVAVSVERHSQPPEAERMDVDHDRGLERDEGIPDQHPREPAVGERAARQVETRAAGAASPPWLIVMRSLSSSSRTRTR